MRAAYEYFQNDALNAADYVFAQKTRRGSDLSSALQQLRLRYRRPDSQTETVLLLRLRQDPQQCAEYGHSTVPTAAMLAGDFTGLPTIYDPATTTVVNGSAQEDRSPMSYGNGNRIPASRIDPVANAIKAYYPAPNSPGTVSSNGIVQNNFFHNVSNSAPFQKFFGRADWDITPNNRLILFRDRQR